MARRRPTLRDVAARAGVSPTTVSLILNERPINVPPETRGRVLAAAAELHYVPNALVRSLQVGRTGTLGVYIQFRASVWQNAFVGALVDGLRRGAAEAGCDVLLYQPPLGTSPPPTARASAVAFTRLSDTERGDDGHERAAFGSSAGIQERGAASLEPAGAIAAPILDGRADAAVLWLAGDETALDSLARAGFPAVVLMHDSVPPPLGAVLVDEPTGSTVLLDHLRSLGHRSIAYYAGGATALSPHLRARRDALLAAAERAGVPVPAHHVLAGPAAALEPLLRAVRDGGAQRPTAIVCAFEELAHRTIDVAARLGLRVPQDLSVAGWEAVDVVYVDGGQAKPSPWLTAVRLPIWEMGRTAAAMAVEMSHHQPARRGPRRTFPAGLQIGGSTGPA